MLRRILVAADFSDCSRAAVEYGAFIARRLGASLELLYVSRVPEVLAGDAAFLGASFVDADVVDGRRKLDGIVSELAREGISCTGRVQTGFAADVLVAEANSGKYDLLVVGTHGRRGFERLNLGSVAAQVVRHAHIPVLTVPSLGGAHDRAASAASSR